MPVSLSSAVLVLLAGTHGAAALARTPVARAGGRRSGNLALRDETPNFPYDPNTIASCTYWWDNDGSIPCEDMAPEWGISFEDFRRWNPSITASCGNFLTERSYCVEAPSSNPPPGPTTTTTTAPPTTTTGNGVITPTPTQPGMVGNCNKFHWVVSGENCGTLARQYGITEQQFQTWNPETGSNCGGLWAQAYACVGIIGQQPPTTTTTSGNGVSTPLPTQAGMVGNCNQFHKVVSGENCAIIGARYGILARRLTDWHSSITPPCQGLWADVNVCVRTIGFSLPAVTNTCHTASDHKTWGGNRQAALDAVSSWCNGGSSGGSGSFALSQIKRGCFNAAQGENRFEYVMRNDFGAPATLASAKCVELLRTSIDRCERGGDGVQEGWWFTARVVAGRC